MGGSDRTRRQKVAGRYATGGAIVGSGIWQAAATGDVAWGATFAGSMVLLLPVTWVLVHLAWLGVLTVASAIVAAQKWLDDEPAQVTGAPARMPHLPQAPTSPE